MSLERRDARAAPIAATAPRRRAPRSSDWSVALGAGLGALAMPLLTAVPPLLEGRLEELPAAALVSAPALGIVVGGAALVPSLRWCRRRLPGLPDGFVILVAGGVALGALVVASAAMTALAGGDGWSALVLGGAALLPTGLSIGVGALFFQALAETRRWLIGGAVTLASAMVAGMLLALA